MRLLLSLISCYAYTGRSEASGPTNNCPSVEDIQSRRFDYRPEGGGNVVLNCPLSGEWNGLSLEVNQGRVNYRESYHASGKQIACVVLHQDWDLDEPSNDFPPQESYGILEKENLVERHLLTFNWAKNDDGEFEKRLLSTKKLGPSGSGAPLLMRAQNLQALCDRFQKVAPKKSEPHPGTLNLETFSKDK